MFRRFCVFKNILALISTQYNNSCPKEPELNVRAFVNGAKCGVYCYSHLLPLDASGGYGSCGEQINFSSDTMQSEDCIDRREQLKLSRRAYFPIAAKWAVYPPCNSLSPSSIYFITSPISQSGIRKYTSIAEIVRK